MTEFCKLERFPLGAITAKGFLEDQMKRGKDGICGHLHELEKEMIADPFIKKSHVPAWKEENQLGWGAEISGNYWTGYIQFAYTLGDKEMIAVAENWVNEMIKKQRADGYLGTYREESANPYEDYNAWGTACAMRGLIAFYEATGREDVLDAVYRCMLWFCDTWAGEKKTCYVGQYIIEPMIFVYAVTGDKRLADFAEEYLLYLTRNDIFHNSYKAMLEEQLQYNANHTAGYGINLRLPALVYAACGNKEYLKASEHGIEQVIKYACHLSGSPVSISEYLGPVGCTTETEYCSYAFYNTTYSYMSFITGNTFYGDLSEQMFYNGAQGARKKDEKAIAYLNAPNQIYATSNSSSSFVDMQVYAPCYPTSCCPVNAVAVVPEFVRGMLLKDKKDNVYVMAYGPCRLDYNDIHITEKTEYPFRNTVCFSIDCDKSFELHLKIPSWSKGYTVYVNGIERTAEKKDGFICLSQSWKCGDTVEISFKAEIEVVKVNDYLHKHPLAVRYGALLFSYHIPEIWQSVEGRPMTKLADGWSWYDVQPYYEEADVPEYHERVGLRRYQISWNIALDENLSAKDFTVEEIETDGYAWETPKIKLHTHCYKAPYLCAMYPKKTFEPYTEYQKVTEKLSLELVPYGCTNLRITYFPKADLKTRNTK